MLLARTPTGGLSTWPGLPHKWWLNSKCEIQRYREPGGSSIVFYNWTTESCSVSSSIFYLLKAHTTAAKSLQSCPTLCDPIDGTPPGSPVPGILQARISEVIAISPVYLSLLLIGGKWHGFCIHTKTFHNQVLSSSQRCLSDHISLKKKVHCPPMSFLAPFLQ